MIPNEEKEGRWHCLAVKKISALLHRITSKNKGDFYCLNCLHSFSTENKLKSHEIVCKTKDLSGIVMPSEKDSILKFNQYMKSDKMSYIIYADIESLIRKIDGCGNNLENSSTTIIGEHIPYGYSMPTIWAFDNIENMHTLSRGEDCMKKFCTSFRDYVTNIINFEKKRMLALTKEEIKSHKDAKVCHICGKRFPKELANDKNYWKVRDHCHYTGKYRGAAHSICNLKFNVPNEIPVVFHNGSDYDYHFIIKKLANEFEGFECLQENTEKYKTFSVPIEKEVTNIDKDGNESIVAISYKIKFIGSARFLASSLSNLVDNLAEGIYEIKGKDCDCFLEYENVKENSVKCKCLSCNKDYSNKIDEELKKRFKNTFKFSDNDINKFILLLRKGAYPYEYMDDWEKFHETTLTEKEEFYSNLNMEDITGADYIMQKEFAKTLK